MVLLMSTTDNTMQKFFYKIKIAFLFTPHLKCMWMKNLITTCFFHVDEFLCLRFYFSEKSLFWDDQYGRCVRGFWRHILVFTLLASNAGNKRSQ